MVPLCYNYVLNYGLCVIGREMAMDFGSTKWNQCLVRGLSTDSPLLILGTVKNSLGLLVGPKMSMCFCILFIKNEWLEIWVEINC